MTRRRSTSRQRATAAIVASERHGSRQPIGRPGTIAESADMPSTFGEALMQRRASELPATRQRADQCRTPAWGTAAFRQTAHDQRDRRNSQCLVPDRPAAYRFRHATCAPIWSVGAHFRPRYCAADGGKSRMNDELFPVIKCHLKSRTCNVSGILIMYTDIHYNMVDFPNVRLGHPLSTRDPSGPPRKPRKGNDHA